MRIVDREELKSAVLSMVQPLYRGAFDSAVAFTAKLKDLVPFGTADRVQHAMPFGLSSKPIPGTYAYFLNLLGNSQAPVIVSHLDLKRPEPNAVGQTILYAVGADGTLSPAMVIVDPANKIKIGSQASAENFVLGQQLKTLLSEVLAKLSELSEKVSEHTHEGNLGYPTSPPDLELDFVAIKENFDNLKSSPVDDSAILSDRMFTEK